MDETPLPYDLWVLDSLRQVVRRALALTAREGLPGEHHFYITFLTHAGGVEVSEHLLAQYPDEMTIVLQRRFWGLEVGEEGFKVGLSFNGRSETLYVPFQAVTAFTDPEANFGLQLKTKEGPGEAGQAEAPPREPAAGSGGKEEAAEEGRKTAEVVALDAFRKN